MTKLLRLFLAVLVSQLAGLLATPFTVSAIPTWYVTLNKPFFSPPNWLFAPVWTTLYLMMGVALYLVWAAKGSKRTKKQALNFFWAQLGLNFLWSILFFGLRSPLLGLLDILVLWLLIVLTIRKFYALSRVAAYLLIPYLLWVGFATLLNGAIWWLN